jgi:hypothetical protein
MRVSPIGVLHPPDALETIARGAIRSFGYFEDGNLVRYDAPGTASIYVLQENPVLRQGLVLQWLTVSH